MPSVSRRASQAPNNEAILVFSVSRPAHSDLYPWYDSQWLAKLAAAKQILQKVRPEVLNDFIEAMRVFHTPLDFQVKRFERVFDDDTMAEIKRVVSSLRPTDLELHEARMFGRFVVHDHPFFTELQHRTVALVSEAAGEPVEVSYNFLSLYSKLGVCPPHMDAPQAKWTLDLCIHQSIPWPIHFSQIVPWPETNGEAWPKEDWENRVKQSPSLRFTPQTMTPGQALLFSGSSQWHYRDPIPDTGRAETCDLLFFHFIPQGTRELVRPGSWARIFGVPELGEMG